MIKVAIVEDQKPTVEAFEHIVRYETNIKLVGSYFDAASAIAEIPANVPDVVVLDIELKTGGRNGLDCLIILSRQFPKMKFLMFTQFDQDEKLFNALRLGAHGYVLKVEGVPNIVKHVKAIHKGHGAMSGVISAKVISFFREEKKEMPQEFHDLTAREKSILELLAKGLSNKEVAVNLGLSYGYVRVVISRIYNKMHENNRYKLIAWYRDLMG